MPEVWEVLFARAVKFLEQGGVAKKDWTFGGGTVLAQKYNHRASKDIDIFFRNPQLLNFISPRVNDTLEASLTNYAEQAHHTRLYFQEGEIDFIVSPQISAMKPSLTKVVGNSAYVEHPVEIVAKKIQYRSEDFTPRDVFDLAVVFAAEKNCMLQNAGAFAEKLPLLARRLEELQTGQLEERLSQLTILPGGEKICGHELALCREFVQAIGKALEKGRFVGKQQGKGLDL